jgi:hypothetical protein
MGLPKIDLPLFELEVPSTGKKIKYRPFTVKEEKILLIAQESKDIDQIVLSIKQVINNCAPDIDTDNLALFDLEYILLHIRAKSVNNVIEFKIKDPSTGEEIELSLDIHEIKLKHNEDHNKIIRLNEDSCIVMRYPSINEIKDISKLKSQESIFNVMISCIDKIEFKDEVYIASEYTREELVEFVDGLTSTDIKLIETFFETIPVLKFETNYMNSKGEKKTFVVEGMETFFI